MSDLTSIRIKDNTHTSIIRCRGYLQYKNPKLKITIDKAILMVCDEYLNRIDKGVIHGKM